MRYLDLFAGIGGFALGIQRAYERTDKQLLQRTPVCIGYSEIDKYAIEVYKKHFPEHKNYGDIRKINAKKLPDFELLVGGFPCQSFSIAGQRRGFDDTRGTLFFDIVRITREKQPRFLLLENVKGLLSHDKGRTFYTIISALNELGYDLQWQVLNSKNHGVPQSRERIFIVGHSREKPAPKVFPLQESTGNADEGNKKGEEQTTTTVTAGWAHRNLRGTHIEQLNKPKYSSNRVYSTDGLCPSLRTMQGGNLQPFIVDPIKAKKVSDIRRITPLECERLQGFPDFWTEYGVDSHGQRVLISDTQRYKVLGNAVTTNVIKDIVCQLLK